MASATDVWCIVVAAGSGRRYGSAKQFETLLGERVVDRSVALAAGCGGVVAVVPAGPDGRPATDVPGADVVVAGGATRSASVRAGLDAVPARAEVVLVHDAARPLATPALFGRVAAAVRDGAEAVVPAVAVVDTICDLDGQVVDRERLRAVQTPQGFAAATLRAAHEGGAEATDDAGLVRAIGARVVLVEGERSNLKITDPTDHVLAEALLRRAAGLAPTDVTTADSP